MGKPPGLRVVSAFQEDAADALEDRRCILLSIWNSGLSGWLPVNRLDTNTTGAMLLAQSRESACHAIQQFAERTVSKEYMCIVHGTLHGEGVISVPIATSRVGSTNTFRSTADP